MGPAFEGKVHSVLTKQPVEIENFENKIFATQQEPNFLRRLVSSCPPI